MKVGFRLRGAERVDEQRLFEKLRRIEALHAGATTDGERTAAGAARGRILERLATLAGTEEREWRFPMRDLWNRRVFIALARRYGLKPYRYKGQRHTTVMLRAPRAFVESTLWPEYQEITKALHSYLDEVTERVIATAIHDDPSEAETSDGDATETAALSVRFPDLNGPDADCVEGHHQSGVVRCGEPPAGESPGARVAVKVGRNDPCPCGSGKKYKKCCRAA